MLKFIMGEKGQGKTKALIDSVHNAIENEKGALVFINSGNRHITDVDYRVRLVDTSEYAIESLNEFYGVLCGILSQNFDVSHIFIDSLTKITSFDEEELKKFAAKTSALCEKHEVNMLVTISMSTEGISEDIKKYLA